MYTPSERLWLCQKYSVKSCHMYVCFWTAQAPGVLKTRPLANIYSFKITPNRCSGVSVLRCDPKQCTLLTPAAYTTTASVKRDHIPGQSRPPLHHGVFMKPSWCSGAMLTISGSKIRHANLWTNGTITGACAQHYRLIATTMDESILKGPNNQSNWPVSYIHQFPPFAQY